ncbi:MAG: DoxX family membrane protein [Alphaproteobacteria bacterium]|nr:DoxX family membrane protein [Alphaproteobacteria bacterium]
MQDDLGKLVLRVTLAVLLLFHGTNKILTGLDGVMGLLGNAGLPAWLAYGAYVGEVLAPILVLLGVFSRIGGALIAINMIVALGLAHLGMLLSVGQSGGYAIELQLFYLFGGVAVLLLGSGRFGLNIGGTWN